MTFVQMKLEHQEKDGIEIKISKRVVLDINI